MPVQGSVMKAVPCACTGKVRKAVLYDCTGQCYEGSAVCLYRAVL